MISNLDASVLTAEGCWGIEREAIRTGIDGCISHRQHPDSLDSISFSRDFSECQLELITGVHPSIGEALAELEYLHQTAHFALGNQLLWPLSMPPLPDEFSAVYPAVFPPDRHGAAQAAYRRYLHAKYGLAVMQISGLHVNFSYPTGLIKALHDAERSETSLRDYSNQLYLRTARLMLRFYPVLLYVFGASPEAGAYLGSSRRFIGQTPGPPAVSLRNSRHGYRNPESRLVSYQSLQEYTDSIRKLIGPDGLASEKEVYTPLRLKPSVPGSCCQTALSSLDRNGIAYLEIRIPDLNPYNPLGIREEQLQFLHLIAMYTALNPAADFPPDASAGYQDWLEECEYYALDGTRHPRRQKAARILDELHTTAAVLDSVHATPRYTRLLDQLTDQLHGKKPLLAEQVYRDSRAAGSAEAFALSQAKQHARQRELNSTQKENTRETARNTVFTA